MMRFRSLEDELYGADEEEASPELAAAPEEEPVAAPEQQQPASMPVEEPELAAPPARAPMGAPSQAPAPAQKEGWSPDFLAAMAAFTRNPALMQQLQAREQNKRQSKLDALRAQQQVRADQSDTQRMDLAAKKDARDQQRFEAEKPYFGAQGASKSAYAAATNQRMQEQQMDSDRQSDRSKAVSAAAASALRAQVAMMEGKVDPKIADMMKRTADSMTGMSVSEIKSIFKASPLAKVVPQALDEAQRAVTNALGQDAASRGWAGVRQGDERIGIAHEAEGRMQDAAAADAKGRQEKLNDTIGKLNSSAQQMRDALGLKGKVNTGPLLQGVRDLFSLDKFDAFTSEERTRLKAIGASIFNEKTHEISGAAVTPSEWLRISPQIPSPDDDDDVYVRKMNEALRITEQILAEKREHYQLSQDGLPRDRSTTARKQVAKMSTPSAAPALRAPPGAKPGQRFKHPTDGMTYEVQPDGTMKKVP